VKYMSIQPISASQTLWQTMKTNLQNLNQSLTAAQGSRSSSNKDQVTLSQDALQKAAAAFQSDISSLLKSAGGASNNTTTTGTSSAPGAKATTLQALNQDLANLQNAIQTGNQNLIRNAVHTLGSDLSGIQKGHHHHHHHGGQGLAPQNYTNSGSIVSDSTGATSAITGMLVSSKV
jgi:DNA polymerase III gamma/tau subunit